MDTLPPLLPPLPGDLPPHFPAHLAPPEGWWHHAFPRTANASERRGHPAGSLLMLTIVAYDITDPKRLRLVAECCKDYGMRIQYSIFECRLQADDFDKFWSRLTALIDPASDRLVAYPMHGASAAAIRTAGTMVCSEAVVAYVF